mmetsp:Transcript_16698/g.54398  ORF Transcript_16698/g.54398 Transcript_16698/m.54398 type:complete len:212 (+) Transcript_16698:501-1136(+)
MASARWKAWMAAPMDVSSCSTGVDSGSRGSMVFRIFMTGSGSRPLLATIVALSLARSTHRLSVLKYRCLAMSENWALSASGHWSLSRSIRSPVWPSYARCPPSLSESVRTATSIKKGASDCANQLSRVRSIVAPRLSELEMNMYLYPAAMSLSSMPEPSRAGKTSPSPGRHHSSSRAAGHAAGDQSSSATFGCLCCISSRAASYGLPKFGW